MDTITLTDHHFLHILQLASSALPVGAYSYSEGLETLVESGTITSQLTLQQWLEAELSYGAIRLEAAVMVRAYQAAIIGDLETLCYWNIWLSAARETQELRNSSWQMGRSLMQLLGKIQPEILSLANAVGNPCNYAIAFGIASAHWQINIQAALLAYLHSWATNLITAGVKLIPLGQTAGQELLLQLQPLISHATAEIMSLNDDELSCCSWGLSLASMQHETQYTRLFRS
ncbi:urease accessory protein UreF [Anabaena sp. CCY 9910]|uniref:urease accessory protein UreF n=1 Tax=Anabaena sp. CCY 9910 TaxID=3103870 RepID=UPI0039E1B05F